MQRFICAGPARSGSTWLFNAVRLIALPCLSAPWEWYIGIDPAPRHVVKIIEAIPSLSGTVLMTSRSAGDRLESALRFGLIEDPSSATEWLKQQEEWRASWERRADIVIPYADILEHPALAIGAIAGVMGMEVNAEEIAERLIQLPGEVQQDGWDSVTLLRKNHRTMAGSARGAG